MFFMKQAIILCHGNLGEGLVSALNQIVGVQQGIHLLSNQGKSAAELYDDIKELRAGIELDDPLILLV